MDCLCYESESSARLNSMNSWLVSASYNTVWTSSKFTDNYFKQHRSTELIYTWFDFFFLFLHSSSHTVRWYFWLFSQPHWSTAWEPRQGIDNILPKLPMKPGLMSEVSTDYIVWHHHQCLIFGLHRQTDANCMLLCCHAFNWHDTAAHSLRLTVCNTCFLQSHMQAATLGHTWTVSGTTCQMKLDFAVKCA